MRRQDAFGIERPSSVDRIVPRITPPEGGDLYKPVRIPRPFLGARSVVYDIQDQTVTYTSDNARTFPRNFGETRGFSDFTYLSDLTPPSEQRPSPPLRTRTTVNQLQTATEVPTVIPRAHGRDRTVISPPQELHHSAEPPLRNPITAVDLARPTAIVPAAPLSSLVIAEAESVESIDESIRGVQMRALHRNSSLMYQRFTFSLTKFPAIVLVLMALWTLWGRGEGLLKDFRPKEEKGADIAALVTGGFLLVSQVFLLHQHCNSYKKAKIMSYLYHITMLLSFCGAAVALVFAAISLKKVKDVNYNDLHFNCKVANISDPDHPNVPHPWLCVTKNQRIDYMGVVIGSSAFVMILAVFTMIAGAIGQFVMADRLASEYQKFVVNNVTPDDEENDHF